MASSSAVSLDTVMIEIESNASQAGDGIGRLASHIASLKESLKGGSNNAKVLADNLQKLKTSAAGLTLAADNIKALGSSLSVLKSLKDIEAPKGLGYTVRQLNALSVATEKLPQTVKALSSIQNITTPLQSLSTIETPKGLNAIARDLEGLSKITNVDTIVSEMSKLPQIVAPLSSLSTIINPKGMTNAINNLRQIPEVMSKFDMTTLENLKRISTELASSLQPLASQLSGIANGYSALSKMSNTYGVSAKTVTRYSRQQVSIFDRLKSSLGSIASVYKKVKGSANDFTKTANRNFEKLNSKIKQIGLSLLGTRTLFTMIRKAVSEYQAFDEELQKFSQNVWRAFGAQLAPAIYGVMELFKQFVRVIYSVVLALTGIDLIAKANEKAMAGWNKATKDTLGNLQKFDDLNVVEFPKRSSEDSPLIELDKIDLSPIQKVIDWVKKLRDEIKAALDTGKWYTVGQVFAEGINEGVEFLLGKLPEIQTKLYEIAINFGDFLNGAIETINWGNIGSLFGQAIITGLSTINSLLTTINWSSVGKAFGNAIIGFPWSQLATAITAALGSAANAFFTTLVSMPWGKIAETIGNSLATFLNGLADAIDNIPWYKVGQTLREAIANIPWKEVWNSIVNVAKESLKGLEEFLQGLFNVDSGPIKAVEGAIVGIGVALVVYDVVNRVKDLVTGLGQFAGISTNLDNAKNALESFGKTLDGIAVDKFLSKAGSGSKNPFFTGSLVNVDTKQLTFLNMIKGSISSIGSAAMNSLPFMAKLFGEGGIIGGGSLAAGGAVIAAIVVAVGALVVAFKELWENSEGFRDTVNKLVEGIQGTFLTVFEALKQVLESVGGVLSNLYNKVLKPLFDLLVEIAKPIIEHIMSVLEVLWNNVISPLVDFILAIVVPAIQRICDKFNFLIDVVKVVIDTLMWLWKNVLGPVVDFILDIVIEAIKTWGAIFESVVRTVTKIIEGISITIDNVWKAVKDIVSKVAGWIYDHMIKPVIDKFIKLKDSLAGIWNNIKEMPKDALNGVLGWIEKAINRAIRGVNNLIDKFAGGLSDFFEWLGFEVELKHIGEISLPRLETGTNEIPYEGLYHLHPGEAVVPKKYNPALGNGGSDEMNDKLDTLIEIMDNMNFTNVVNVGNKKLYEGQQAFNKRQQNKYGTINLY